MRYNASRGQNEDCIRITLVRNYKVTSYIWLEHHRHAEQSWNDVYRLNSKHKPTKICTACKQTVHQLLLLVHLVPSNISKTQTQTLTFKDDRDSMLNIWIKDHSIQKVTVRTHIDTHRHTQTSERFLYLDH